jgi:hypothetical protein
VAGDAEAARHIAGEYVRKSFKFNNLENTTSGKTPVLMERIDKIFEPSFLENTTSGKTPVLMEQRYRQDSGKGKNEKNSFRRQHWGVRQECYCSLPGNQVKPVKAYLLLPSLEQKRFMTSVFVGTTKLNFNSGNEET